MDLDLQEKVAVITGGRAGIGLAVAKGLAQKDIQVDCSLPLSFGPA